MQCKPIGKRVRPSDCRRPGTKLTRPDHPGIAGAPKAGSAMKNSQPKVKAQTKPQAKPAAAAPKGRAAAKGKGKKS